MMSGRLNASTMATASDVADFAYATIQPYVGFDPAAAGMAMAMAPNDVHPMHHHLYDAAATFDFAATATPFPFQHQQDAAMALFSGSAPGNMMQALAAAGSSTSSSSLQMPPTMMMTLPPGVPGMADVYQFGAGGGLVKREDGSLVDASGGGGRIGLNLGRRTYFSAADALAVDRLLMRSRLGGGDGGGGVGMGLLGLGLGAGVHQYGHHHHQQPPRCQAEGCKADLSAAKHYHRRHKVCEYHAKASAVVAGCKQQRFCQQCSRFHALTEFDDNKRSCRKRLTEHNRRRRKPAPAAGAQNKDSPPSKKAADHASISSSYAGDHKASASMTMASGASCLKELDNNGQTNTAMAPAAPTTGLSLSALPPRSDDDLQDGGLGTMLLVQQQHRGHEDEQSHENVITTPFATSQRRRQQQQQQRQHHNSSGSNNDNVPSCSSPAASDQQNSSCNNMHFFEMDFI